LILNLVREAVVAKELSDFGKAFAAARKAQGAGGTFEYKGTKYSTRRADDEDVTVSASKKFPNKENYKSDAKAAADDADTLKRTAGSMTPRMRAQDIEAEEPKRPRFGARESGRRERMEEKGYVWDVRKQEYLPPLPKGMKKGGAMKESKMMVKKEIEFFKKKGAPKSMIKHEEKEAKGKGKMAGGGMLNTRKKAKTFPTASAARKDMDEMTVTAPRIRGAGRLEEAVVTAPRIKGAGYARGGGVESRGKTRGKFV
jgi:hypothetical protein